MHRLAILTALVVLSGCALEPDFSACWRPDLGSPERDRAWARSLQVVRGYYICDRDEVQITIRQFEGWPPGCISDRAYACAHRHPNGAYSVHLGTVSPHPFKTLVHEFLHVQMWRLGWAVESHHDRMPRLGFYP